MGLRVLARVRAFGQDRQGFGERAIGIFVAAHAPLQIAEPEQRAADDRVIGRKLRALDAQRSAIAAERVVETPQRALHVADARAQRDRTHVLAAVDARHDRERFGVRVERFGQVSVSCWMLPSVDSSGASSGASPPQGRAIDDDRVAREALGFVVMARDHLDRREARLGVRGFWIFRAMRRAQPRHAVLHELGGFLDLAGRVNRVGIRRERFGGRLARLAAELRLQLERAFQRCFAARAIVEIELDFAKIAQKIGLQFGLGRKRCIDGRDTVVNQIDRRTRFRFRACDRILLAEQRKNEILDALTARKRALGVRALGIRALGFGFGDVRLPERKSEPARERQRDQRRCGDAEAMPLHELAQAVRARIGTRGDRAIVEPALQIIGERGRGRIAALGFAAERGRDHEIEIARELA